MMAQKLMTDARNTPGSDSPFFAGRIRPSMADIEQPTRFSDMAMPAYSTGATASLFAPGAGVVDIFGGAPDPFRPGEMLPSFGENIGQGNYLDAGLQTLGAAGDVALAAGALFPPALPAAAALGTALKAPRAAKVAGQAIDAAKNVDEARAALEASPNDPVLKQQYLDLRRARDAELSQMSPDEQLALDASYRMDHQPRGPQEGGGRLDDITAGGELFPDDVYSANGLRFYGNPNNSFDRQSHAAILAARGNPEAEITIYRGVPTDVNQINAGDWVTLSPDYAAMHAASGYGPNGDQAGKVISQRVKVKDVFSDGNDLNEFGYFPADLAELGVKKIVPPTETEPGIIAFHGSGADFDEFRLEMIGTGEGAQAYGYGLYFTDSEDIAKFYKDALGSENLVLPSGQTVRTTNLGDMAVVEDALPSELEQLGVINQAPDGTARYNKPSVLIAEAIGEAGSDDLVGNTRKYLETKLKTESSFERQRLGFTKAEGDALEEANINALAAFDKMIEAGIETKTGKMYKVALSPKPDELLDYDLPLNQQPRPVQKLIENAVGDLLAGEPEAYNNFDFPALAAIQGDTKSNWMGQKIPPEGYSPTGDDILRDLKKFFESQDWQNELYGRGDRLASELMTDFGIPGIKYRASGSRGAGTADEAAERNYVIFDDKAVKILEKYGIAGPVLVTGAAVAASKAGNDNEDGGSILPDAGII